MNRDPACDDHRDHRKRLRQRFLSAGIGALHEHEVVELLLTCAIPRRDVKPQAKELLRVFGSLRAIVDAEIDELAGVRGIGRDSAAVIRFIKELAALYLEQRARQRPQIGCTSELLDFCRASLGGKKDEEFWVIYLDAQNRIIEIETLQRGIVSQTVVYPRQVLERALRKKASALILAHNHPSGHVRPSDADIRLTKTLQETAQALDILIHDHVIIGEHRFFSFREEGLMR